jgi:SAM-dependent methyltransferase
MAATQLEQAQKAWDNFDLDLVRNVSWLAIKGISEQTHTFPPTGGIVSYIDQLLLEAFPNRRHELTGAAVVCGDMEGERGIFEQVTSVRFKDVAGFDLSEVSLKRVRPTSFRFHAVQADCNDLVLDAEQFDLVVGSMGIHHVFNVGGLFYQINKSLRPGGVFYMHEWVGPEKLQIPRMNAFISRLLLYTLFSRKERTTHENRVKGRFITYGPEFFDPSEACNSLEIETQLAKYFEVKSAFAYGALCYPMFEGLGRNFRQTRRFDSIRIKLVIALERFLTAARVIQPLFLIVIAKKREVWK